MTLVHPGRHTTAGPCRPAPTPVDTGGVRPHPRHLGGGQTGRAGADDPDRFAAFGRRADRLDPAVGEGLVAQPGLDRPDGHGVPAGLVQGARPLAQPVLRADPTADFRHGRGQGRDAPGLARLVLGRQAQPVGDVVLKRAGVLAEGHAAVGAARRLFLGRLGRGRNRDLAETACAQFGRGLGQAARFDDECPALLQGLMHISHMPQTVRQRQILLPRGVLSRSKRINRPISDLSSSKVADAGRLHRNRILFHGCDNRNRRSLKALQG